MITKCIQNPGVYMAILNVKEKGNVEEEKEDADEKGLTREASLHIIQVQMLLIYINVIFILCQ